MAPKVTTLNGQRAIVRLQGHEGGLCDELQMEVTPSVAPDRRTVKVDFLYQMTAGDGPVRKHVKFHTTRVIPDGQTFITGGWKVPHNVQVSVPVLDKIPYVCRLFRGCCLGKSESAVVLMVTPRIIVEEEEEQGHGTGCKSSPKVVPPGMSLPGCSIQPVPGFFPPPPYPCSR
jgi:type II secretory pathway component GspD/PulD (secretin)